MKRILLGSSTLCAVAVAGPAFAQTTNEPVKLGIGGYFNSAYGDLVSQSGSGVNKKGRRTDDIDTDAILNFKGSTKLDNGITAGVSIQMRSEDLPTNTAVSPDNKTATTDRIKRSYGYLRSEFGEIRIGDDDDARRQKAMTSPIAGLLFGANDPDLIFGNGPALTNTTARKIEGDKRISRLAYFSPTIAGFSFAVSYAPGGEKGGTLFLEPNTSQTNGISAVNNAVSVAAAYTGKFGDFTLNGFSGFSSGHRVLAAPGNNGSNVTGRDNPLAWNGGAIVGWGPISFGATYEFLRDRDLPVTVGGVTGGHQERNTWDVGGKYTLGPFAASLGWTRAILDNREGNSSAQQDIYSLTTDYLLGPGIDVSVGANYTHFQTNTTTPIAGDENYAGLALMAGMGISF